MSFELYYKKKITSKESTPELGKNGILDKEVSNQITVNDRIKYLMIL